MFFQVKKKTQNDDTGHGTRRHAVTERASVSGDRPAAWSCSCTTPVQPPPSPAPRRAADPVRGFGTPPAPTSSPNSPNPIPPSSPRTPGRHPAPHLADAHALAPLASSRLQLQRPRPRRAPTQPNPTLSPLLLPLLFLCPTIDSSPHLTSPPHPLFRAPHFTLHLPLPLKTIHPTSPYPPTSAID